MPGIDTWPVECWNKHDIRTAPSCLAHKIGKIRVKTDHRGQSPKWRPHNGDLARTWWKAFYTRNGMSLVVGPQHMALWINENRLIVEQMEGSASHAEDLCRAPPISDRKAHQV